jgi:GTP-binding protein HflX
MEDHIPLLYGKLTGLKGSQIHALERIYRRRVHPELVTVELAKYVAGISSEVKRQIGILVSRKGSVTHVIVGEPKGVLLPPLDDYPLGRRVLRGLRFIHTHLSNEPLNQDDLTDLALLRLDAVAAIGIKDGQPTEIHIAHMDGADDKKPFKVLPPEDIHNMKFDFDSFVKDYEQEQEKTRAV